MRKSLSDQQKYSAAGRRTSNLSIRANCTTWNASSGLYDNSECEPCESDANWKLAYRALTLRSASSKMHNTPYLCAIRKQRYDIVELGLICWRCEPMIRTSVSNEDM